MSFVQKISKGTLAVTIVGALVTLVGAGVKF